MSNDCIIPFFRSDEIQRALAAMIEPDAVFEIRILEPKRGNRGYVPRVIYGYFNEPSKVSEALASLGLDGAKGVYVTLNPVNPALLARSCNRFTEAKDGQTTSDKDILIRRWLLVDIDPKRPAGISASDDEKRAAHQNARGVFTFLKGLGWPSPIVTDSGNGFHLLYRIDVPADSNSVKQCLDALAARFSDEAVAIDTSVFNPARIIKLYGTRTEKGDHCPELGRAHRLSALLDVPESLQVVSEEMLELLASEAVPSKTSSGTPVIEKCDDSPEHIRFIRSASSTQQQWDKERVQQFVDNHLAHCCPASAVAYDGGFKWVLDICPFNPDHTNHSAVIVIKADGTLGFRCLHDGCKEHNWRALRAKFDPGNLKTLGRTAHPSEASTREDESNHGPAVLRDAKGILVDLNQMFFANKYARENAVLHETARNLFYAYDEHTGLWKIKTDSKLCVEIGKSIMQTLAEQSASAVLRKRTHGMVQQTIGFLRGLVEHEDPFIAKHALIHVGNGVLDISGDSPTLLDFSPSFYSRNRTEVLYNPYAECPRFLSELLRPALNADDMALLQMYAGQCLLGNNLAQAILLLLGTAGGGKSTLVSVLESVIGLHNVAQLRVPQLSERFEIASFVGKTLLCGKDVPGDFLNHKSAHVIKALVGGDRLDAEEKNVKRRFQVEGNFNVIITSNSRQHVRLDSDASAWRRRLLIITYEQPPVAKPIPNLAAQLVREEGAGILNWMIEGALKLISLMAEHGRIVLNDAQRKRVDDLLCESDGIRQFVRDSVLKVEDADVTTSELMNAYHDFCDDHGWQPVSGRHFEHQIGDIMMEMHRSPRRTDIKRYEKNNRGFKHVGLRARNQLSGDTVSL